MSRGGTTQGGPEGMTKHGIALLPLIKQLRHLDKQLGYCNDSAAGGKLEQLKSWWEALKEFKPNYGYASETKLPRLSLLLNVNSWTFVIVKREFVEKSDR